MTQVEVVHDAHGGVHDMGEWVCDMVGGSMIGGVAMMWVKGP